MGRRGDFRVEMPDAKIDNKRRRNDLAINIAACNGRSGERSAQGSLALWDILHVHHIIFKTSPRLSRESCTEQNSFDPPSTSL